MCTYDDRDFKAHRSRVALYGISFSRRMRRASLLAALVVCANAVVRTHKTSRFDKSLSPNLKWCHKGKSLDSSPPRIMVLLSEPRTGSSLASSLIAESPDALPLFEIFNKFAHLDVFSKDLHGEVLKWLSGLLSPHGGNLSMPQLWDKIMDDPMEVINATLRLATARNQHWVTFKTFGNNCLGHFRPAMLWLADHPDVSMVWLRRNIFHSMVRTIHPWRPGSASPQPHLPFAPCSCRRRTQRSTWGVRAMWVATRQIVRSLCRCHRWRACSRTPCAGPDATSASCGRATGSVVRRSAITKWMLRRR